MSSQGSGSSKKQNFGGRPPLPAGKKKSARVSAWVTAQEKRQIQQAARAASLSQSAYVRRRLLGQKTTPLVRANTRSELRRIGVHLRQVARQEVVERARAKRLLVRLEKVLGKI